jgi:hypothetical protein
LVSGGVVWVVVYVVVIIVVWVVQFFPKMWMGEVLIGLFRIWMLTGSSSSWLSSLACSCCCSASSVTYSASSTCCCADASRASPSIHMLSSSSSSLYLCTLVIGSPRIGSLSLLDNLCQMLYHSSTGMAPFVFPLLFGQ